MFLDQQGPRRRNSHEVDLPPVRHCRRATVRIHYLIVFNLLKGRGAYQTAAVLHVHNTTVYRVARRFRAYGEASLLDGREDNGTERLSEH